MDVDKQKTLIVLVVMQCVYVLFLIFWLYFAMISTMMFDSPGSEDRTWLFMLYIMIWLYTLGLLAGGLLSWLGYRKGKYSRALWWNAIPLLWVVPIASVYLYAMIS